MLEEVEVSECKLVCRLSYLLGLIHTIPFWCWSEQAEVSEEEVGCGDEEDTRNMEDDSINLMLEDEEKMLEDELTFNEPERHEQVRKPRHFNYWGLLDGDAFSFLNNSTQCQPLYVLCGRWEIEKGC